ncbi:hypothetical protein V1478_004660 [Vespula squamosa]|uniref:Vitellogenin domain-containing protein n=1 Tax=Vespula squamosa TaxID=30214 RepID=A0ABD2BGT3_VESSQ
MSIMVAAQYIADCIALYTGTLNEKGNHLYFFYILLYHGFCDNTVFFRQTSFTVLTSCGSTINDTDNWKVNGTYYQPEYTYFVNMNYEASAEKNLPVIYKLNLTSVMKCQAKQLNILLCSLEKKRSILLDLKHDTYFDRIQTRKDIFEIRFDKYGVESIRVSSEIDASEYGLIKLIVSQLNIGTNLRSHRSSLIFLDKENSTAGRCDTLFTVTQYPCKETNFTIADYKNYKMRTVLYDFLSDTIVLRKRRNVRKCERSPEVSPIEINNSVNLTMTSSYSEIHFCENSFESSTIIEGKSLTIDHDPRTSVFRQVINVRLKNIGKSLEDLSLPTDIATDIIYLHKNVESNHFDTPCQDRDMNLTLIPFFLATQFALPEVEKWKYGPEINYQVNLLTTVINEGEDDRLRIDLNGAMGCRSKNEDSILCRISTMKYHIFDVINNVNETSDIIVNKHFEIDFNENGIEKLVMENPIHFEHLKLIYNFVAQLNIGVNIGQHLKTTFSFVKKENFTLGECDTIFNISLKEKDRSSSSFSEEEDEEEIKQTEENKEETFDDLDDVKLTLIGVPKISGDVDLVIEKIRNPKRCTRGDKYMFWLAGSSEKFNVISSFSRINVKENESFESSTITMVKLKLLKPAILHEFTRIKLKSINQATGPLPTITRPVVINFSSDDISENNLID